MRSKYHPLQEHLSSRGGHQLTMTFPEIEKVLGAALPPSAYKHREWWSNQSDISNRPQAKAWILAGYEVDDVRQQHIPATVRFRRRLVR